MRLIDAVERRAGALRVGVALAMVVAALVFPDRNWSLGDAQATGAPTITAIAVGPSIGSGVARVAFTAGSFASPVNYEYSTDGGATWIARSPASTASPINISGLNNCQTYAISIRAVNASAEASAAAAAWSTVPRAYDYVFRTATMRFGNGSQASVNASSGNLEQPWYSYDGGSNYSKLTFSSRSLESAIAVGGDGANEWNRNGTTSEISALRHPNDGAASPSSNYYLDCSEFVQSSVSGTLAIGYGTLTVQGRLSVGGTALGVARRYSLGASDRFLAVRETVTNMSASTASNVRLWTGTGDDWVVIDSPNKIRGNIVDGSFVQNSAVGLRSKALQVNSGNESVYFYTTSNIGDMSWSNCCAFSNAYNQNPRTNATQSDFRDGSYALYLRFQDLAPSGSESFTWYYAAGRTADLASVLSSLDSAAKPAAPTITGITPGNRQLSVAFTAGASGGSALTNYEYSTDGGSTWVARSPGATSSPLVITGLSNGTSYSVRIRAVNSEGSGVASNTESGTPLGTPEAPSISSVTVGEDSIDIEFVAGGTGGSAITGYEYSTDGGATWSTATVVGSSVSITGLSGGTDYSVALRAINTNGAGTASATQSVRTGSAPLAPTISAISAFNGALSVAFAEGANGGSPTSNLQYSINGGVTWVTRSPASTASPLTITGLVNGTEYDVQVRMVNAIGSGAASATTSATPRSVPGAPSISGATTPSSGTLAISITAGSTGGSPITSYQYSTDRGATWRTRQDGETTSLTVEISTLSADGTTALTNGTEYCVQIRAVNAAGNGIASPDICSTPRTAPEALTITSSTARDKGAQISYSFGSNGGSAITAVEYSTDGGNTWVTAGALTSPLIISGLDNATTYDVKLRARNAEGAGAETTGVSITPAARADAPTLAGVTAAAGQLSVAFSAPSGTGGSAISNYEYSTDGGATWTTRSPAATTSPLVITGLANGTNYGVSLRAVTAAGGGVGSAVLYGQPVDVPSAPTNFSVVAANQRLLVSFTAAASNGSPITTYEYSTNGGSTWVSAATTANSFDITGLTNGTSYAVQVRAINAVGTGAATSSVSASPAAVPGSPIISAIANSASQSSLTDGQASVAFTAGASNGSDITNYQYSLSTDGGQTYGDWTVRSPASYFSPLVISGLTSGTTYHVRIRAVNANGAGQASESLAVTAGGAVSLTVSYDTQGGSAISSGSTMSGASIAASPGTPTRAGFAFNGWFAASSGGTAITFPYAHGRSVNFTLYAQWTPNALTVTYDTQGGSAISSGSTTSGASIAASPGTPTRAGYTFNGWFAASSGGSAITFPYVHSRLADFTLYAQWTPNTLTVTYDTQGGSAIGSDSTATGDSIAASPGTPTRSGYTFNGWFAASSGGSPISFPYVHGRTANFTLYAQWTLVPVVVVPAATTTTTTSTTVPVTVPVTATTVPVTATTVRVRRATTTTTVRRVVTTSTTSPATTTTTVRPVVTTSTTLRPVVTTSTTVRPVVTTSTTVRPAVSPTSSVAQRVVIEVVSTTTVPASTNTLAGSVTSLPGGVGSTTLPLSQVPTADQLEREIAQRESNVQDLSLPVFVNSELPTALPESPLVIQTSGDKVLDIITVNEQVVQLQDSEGFRLSVSAVDSQGNMTTVNTRGAIVVSRRNFITVTGEGFMPNSDAVAWLFSQPRRLGVVRVGADGRFEESLRIADDVPMGDHTTQVNGLTPEGEVRSLNLAVEVVDAGLMVTDTTIDPMLIAATGPRNSTTLSVALLAVGAALGAGVFALLLVVRRRRESARNG